MTRDATPARIARVALARAGLALLAAAPRIAIPVGERIELQRDMKRSEAAGLRRAGISPDSLQILGCFSKRHEIDFPMASDPCGATLRSYGIRNESAAG